MESSGPPLLARGEELRLVSARLALREFREEDWSAALAWESDPAVVRYLGAELNTDPDRARANLRRVLAYRREHPRVRFVLALVPAGQEAPIGWCMLSVTDVFGREGELGWAVAREHWGRGYATEAAGALLRFGFTDLNLHRIFAACHPANLASERVMRKLGMRREGHFQEKEWIKGAWWDEVVYAILDREWRGAGGTESVGA